MDSNLSFQKKNDLSIVLCGKAGQGIQTVEYLLTRIFKLVNPLATAIALDASFFARGFAGDAEQTKEILKKAIKHKGYALLDIFQPCVSFNKLNSYEWFKKHTYYLEDLHDPFNRNEAFKKATEKGQFPLGIFYINPDKRTFEENIGASQEKQTPLYGREPDLQKLCNLVDKFKILI